SRAEIWAAEAWESYLEEKETAFSETDEDAFPGII
ncbi:MAG: Transcriptional regulator MraZ, partial [Micrococcaceae bacterium]|nr:Transcriptional regulator MraZ [Micrococcaceae bacterium]